MNRNDQFSESTLQLFGALANHSRADINKLASVWSRQDGDNNHFDDRHEMQQGDEDGPQHHQQQPQSAADDHHGGASSFSLQGNNEHAYQHKDSGYNYEQRSEDGSRASSRAGSRAGSRASSKASSRASRKSQRHAFVDIGEDDENDVPPGIDLTRINNNNPQQSAVLSAKGFVQSHEPGTAHNNRHTTSSAERRLHERSSRSAASSGRSHRHHRRHHHHHHSHRHRDQEQGNDRHRSHHSHHSGNELRGEGSGVNNRSGYHRSSGYRSSGSRQQDAAADKHHYSASHILRVEDEEKEMVIRQIQNFEERYGFFLKRPVSRQDTLGACRAALEDLKNRKIQEENASFVFNMVVGGCGLIEWGMVSLGATKMHGWSQCLKYHDKISTNNAHNNNLKPIMIELAKRMFTQGEKSNPYLQLGVALARSAGEYFKHGPPPPEAPLQPQYQTATTAPSSSSSSNTTNSGTYVHVNHNTSQPLPTPTPGSNQAPATGPTLRPLPFARARAPPTNNPAAPSAGGGGGGLSSLVSMLPTFLSMMSA